MKLQMKTMKIPTNPYGNMVAVVVVA